MLHVLFVILFIALRLTVGQQPSQEQCQSLLNVSSCQPWGNCSGLQCPGKGSIVVFKCQDPVVVQLTVNGTTARNVTQSSLYADENNSTLAISVQRDTDSLFFNATVDGAVVVPNVAVPLNASYCAWNPPAVQISLVDTSGYAVLYNGTFDRSQNVSVSPLLTLSVEITPRQYSMDVGVSVSTPVYGTIPIFVKRTIILDKSTCSLPPVPANPTCQALQNLRTRLPLCSLNQACNGLNCAVLGAPYTVAFEVQPCTQPPSIFVTVRDQVSGVVVYNSSVNDSTAVSLGPNVSLSIVLKQLPSAIALKVDLLLPSGAINLVPFYVIPIDQSQCGFGSGSEPFTPSPPSYPTQCQAFSEIGNTTSICTANPSCDGVTCSLPGGLVTRVGVLPCNTPPAISLTVEGANGSVLFSRAIDRTQQVPLVGGTSLLVVVNQLPNATIGFQVDLQTLVGTTNIIPYTTFPLNTTGCGPTQVPPTLSPQQPGTACAALSGIASSQPLCSTNVACDQIDCSVQGYTTAMTVSILGGVLGLQVTVDQLDSALGIKLDVTTPFGTSNIIPFTVVPLNTSSCPPTPAPPTSSPETTTCSALRGVSSSNPTCLANEACNGLTCTTLGLSTGFTILPCNSPPAIALSVNGSNGTSLYSGVISGSQFIPLGGTVTLVIVVDQLNNSLGIRVDALSAFGGVLSIIPYTVIPLNTSNCGPTQATPTTSPLLPTTTCSALQSIPLTTGGRSCSVRPTCDQLDCTVLGYTASFVVLPCNSPPAVSVMVNSSANATLFYQVVSTSQRVPLFGVTALDITVVQLNNSIGFKVDVIPLPGISPISLVPFTIIPLNTSNCGPTQAPPTPTPPTNTCGALSTITSLNAACTPTPACDGVNCAFLNYTLSLSVLPCSSPPGVQLNVLGPQGVALYSQTLTQSQRVTVLPVFLSLDVTVVQLNGSLGVQVNATTPIGTSTVIPYTVIPLNTSNCASVPTQGKWHLALRSIATSGQYCSATALCDGVDCQYLNYRIRMRLLPCSNPPSIALTAYDQTTGTVYYNQTLSQSQRTTLVNGFLSLDVTLLQRSNAIALQVDLVPIAGPRINIIPYTLIPVSTAGCSNSTQLPTQPPTPPSSSTSRTSPSSPTTSPPTTQNGGTATQAQAAVDSSKVAIAVPVTVILVLLVVAVVVVVVFVVRKRKPLIKAPANCDSRGEAFSLTHALDCRKGGLVIQRRNEIRDAIGDLASIVYTERGMATSNGSDIRVVDTDAPSYSHRDVAAILSTAEEEKKRDAAEARKQNVLSNSLLKKLLPNGKDHEKVQHSEFGVLGAPIGDLIFCAKFISNLRSKICDLLSRLLQIGLKDPQVAYLLLRFGGSFCKLAQLSPSRGGLGLRSLYHHSSACFIASISQSGIVLGENHHLEQSIDDLNHITGESEAVSVQGILDAPPRQRNLSSKIEDHQLRMLFDLASSPRSVPVYYLCHPPTPQLGSQSCPHPSSTYTWNRLNSRWLLNGGLEWTPPKTPAVPFGPRSTGSSFSHVQKWW
ncbi:hypothetical protein EMCRGX_G018527 [Ephydatia muelleri]